MDAASFLFIISIFAFFFLVLKPICLGIRHIVSKMDNIKNKGEKPMRFFKMIACGTGLLLVLFIGNMNAVHADSGDKGESINEKYGLPVVVYGEALSDAQKEEVRELLNVNDPAMVKEITVTGEDLVQYIDGDPHSNMYSSAKIKEMILEKVLLLTK